MEWVENPVTEELLRAVNEEIGVLLETPISDCLVHGQPELTQDNLVDLDTRRYTWEIFKEILEGDWSYLEEEDDGDSETGYELSGYHSER